MRYVFYEKFLLEKGTFIDNVSLMTYGDDNIMSVSKECEEYNHTSISEAFLKLGIVYTMADKEAESVPFINIKDASFLKRSWRHDEDLGCYMAPLEHDSIEKMLMVWVRSKSITECEQGIAVINSAIREYFFYGKEIFEEKRKMLANLIIDLGWEKYAQYNTLPSYNDLKHDFITSSKRCKLYNEVFSDYDVKRESPVPQNKYFELQSSNRVG